MIGPAKNGAIERTRSSEKGPHRATRHTDQRPISGLFCAEELLLQLGTDKNIEQAMSEIVKMQPNMLRAMGVPADALDSELNTRMFEFLKRELAWNKVKDSYIDIYAEVFTENEMRDVIEFYKSPESLKAGDDGPSEGK